MVKSMSLLLVKINKVVLYMSKIIFKDWEKHIEQSEKLINYIKNRKSKVNFKILDINKLMNNKKY